MALALTSSKSSQAQAYNKHRWIIQFSEIPGNSSNTNAVEDLAFCAHTSTTPVITYNVGEMHRLNEKFKTAGKASWNQLSMSFYDFITTDGTQAPAQTSSAGLILNGWSKVIYDPSTGEMGYKTEYAKNAALAQLDPKGNIIRTWNLFYIWPSNIDFGGGLSYDDDAAQEITATFEYDYAIMA